MPRPRAHKPIPRMALLVAALMLLVAVMAWLAWFVGSESISEPATVKGPVSPGPDALSEQLPVAAYQGDTGAASSAPGGGSQDLQAQGVLPETLERDLKPRTIPGSIAGVVVSSFSGLPLNNFVVRLHPGGDPGPEDWPGAETRRVQSPSGAFDLGQREPGTYALSVTAPGHVPFEVTGVVVPGSEHLQLRLSAGAVMSGRLTDAFGGSAADVPVELRPLPGAAGQHGGFVRRAQTDAEGRYLFSNIEPGDWQVVVPDPHDGASPLLLAPAWTAGPNMQGAWDASLPPETALHLEVLCEGGPAAPGTRVRLVDASGRGIQLKVAGGFARFSRLAPGPYELVIEHGSGALAWQEQIVLGHALEPVLRRIHIPKPQQPPAGDG